MEAIFGYIYIYFEMKHILCSFNACSKHDSIKMYAIYSNVDFGRFTCYFLDYSFQLSKNKKSDGYMHMFVCVCVERVEYKQYKENTCNGVHCLSQMAGIKQLFISYAR